MVNIAPSEEDFKKKNKSKVKFEWVDNGFLNWIKLSGKKDKKNPALKDQDYYVKWDHSGVILIIGKRRSGKGVTGYAIIKEFQKYDPDRVIAIWKAPPQVVPYLKSHGINAIDVDDMKKLPKNCIWFIDEGIINTNAKKALTTFAVELEQNLAILSHKRILLMITFQRWGIFASLVEMSDATIYKQLGSKMTNRAVKDVFLKQNLKIINAMPKDIALIESSLDGFNGTGFLNINLPDFYGSKLSESYKDTELDFTIDARRKRQLELDDYSLSLAKDSMCPSPSDKAYYHALVSEIKHRFLGANLKQGEITDVIQGIYRIMRLHPYLLHEGNEDGEVLDLKPFKEISDTDWKIFKEFADGVSSTEFKRYGMTKSTAMISIRETGKFLIADYYRRQRVDKEGRKYERLVANHYVKKGDYFSLSPANDGTRGKYSLEPDGIHFLRDSIRIVQIKARKGFVESFKAGTFDTELNIAKILNEMPFFKGKVSAWLYYIPKKVNPEKTWQIELSEESRTKTTHVDYKYQLVEYNLSNVQAEKNRKAREEETKDAKKPKKKLKPTDKRLKVNMKPTDKRLKINRNQEMKKKKL